ncbi:hypothetical protein [Terriglobus roseus]|uniref:hypothetical protein n=1 Tax=Terriglobus roseus TaxID=392734 RepID=UPI00145EE53A|nr:hypothetical protein [Terriglobus roseus]
MFKSFWSRKSQETQPQSSLVHPEANASVRESNPPPTGTPPGTPAANDYIYRLAETILKFPLKEQKELNRAAQRDLERCKTRSRSGSGLAPILELAHCLAKRPELQSRVSLLVNYTPSRWLVEKEIDEIKNAELPQMPQSKMAQSKMTSTRSPPPISGCIKTASLASVSPAVASGAPPSISVFCRAWQHKSLTENQSLKILITFRPYLAGGTFISGLQHGSSVRLTSNK